LLASGNTVTQKGWQFIASLMGCREATTQEVQAAREAATPGIVNQWDFPLADWRAWLAAKHDEENHGRSTPQGQ
jgi:hypothetical protein